MSQKAAAYSPEMMLIRVGPELQLIGQNGQVEDVPVEARAVFFHEYIHYLHNISTYSGVYVLLNTIELWRCFRETFDKSGLSAGSDRENEAVGCVLSPVWKSLHDCLCTIGVSSKANAIDRRRTDHHQRLMQYLGHARMKCPRVPRILVKPTRIEIVSCTLRVQLESANGDGLLSALDYDAVLRDEHGEKEKYAGYLGTVELLEGAAWLLENRYLSARHPHGSALETPVFPYGVALALAKHTVPDISHDDVLKCILGALLSSDAPDAFFQVLTVAAQAKNAKMDVGECVSTAIKQALDDTVSDVLGQLDKLEREFHRTGIIQTAIREVADVARKALSLRSENPTFEFDVAEALGAEKESFIACMSAFPPCDILQVNIGDEHYPGRDFLFTIGSESDGKIEISEAMRVLHAMFDFLMRHCSEDGFLPTKHTEKRPCPYYSSCELALRTQDPDVCRNAPWESADWPQWSGKNSCWYGTAVLNTRPPRSISSRMRDMCG